MQKIFTFMLLLGLLTQVAARAAGAPENNPFGVPLADTIPPTIICPASSTVSTDPFTCTHFYTYTVTANDNEPGVTLGQLQGLPSNSQFPQGLTVNTFVATDVTGNTATCSFTLTVVDYVPPVAVCDEFTVVSIGTDDSNDCYVPSDSCHFTGVTWIKAATFDDGSYDNCADIHVTIQRLAPYSNFINALNAVNGHPPCNDGFPDFPSEFERAISESDSIKFYCDEAGTSQFVVMRTYQLDENGAIDLGPGGEPIFNECYIQVEIQDKIKPVATCPPNVTVNAVQFDTSLDSYGVASLADNCCLDQQYDDFGQCGLSYTTDYTDFDSLSSTGTIFRKFRAYDCWGNSSQCTQRIVVENTLAFFVRFPDDVVTGSCNANNLYGEPQMYNPLNHPLGMSYEDQVFDVVPDACYKIERTWTIIDWLTYDPNLPCMVVPNPTPNPVVNHPSNLYGPVVSLGGADEPWTSTVVKISPTDPVATDFSIFWEPDVNCFKYKQLIKILDFDIPEQTGGPYVFDVLDSTANDNTLWNETYWNIGNGADRAEATVDLKTDVTDDCSGANLNAWYLLFLDLNNDGVQETVVNSADLPPANTVYFDNAQLPNYIGGMARSFDERAVPAEEKYRFTLRKTAVGANVSYSVAWNTEANPTVYVAPQLPYGTHKIKWSIGDNCGNMLVTEEAFVLSGAVSGVDIPSGQDFFVGQNAPNPFGDETLIPIRLPEAMPLTLKIFDATGRLVYTAQNQYPAGLNTVRIHNQQLKNAEGVLFYQIETPYKSVVKQMVRVR